MTPGRKVRVNGADLRRFVEWAKAQGWEYSITGSGHFKWSHPQVERAVFTPATPRVSGFVGKERSKLRTALKRALEGAPA
jgi:hypothetical protein